MNKVWMGLLIGALGQTPALHAQEAAPPAEGAPAPEGPEAAHERAEPQTRNPLKYGAFTFATLAAGLCVWNDLHPDAINDGGGCFGVVSGLETLVIALPAGGLTALVIHAHETGVERYGADAPFAVRQPLLYSTGRGFLIGTLAAAPALVLGTLIGLPTTGYGDLAIIVGGVSAIGVGIPALIIGFNRSLNRALDAREVWTQGAQITGRRGVQLTTVAPLLLWPSADGLPMAGVRFGGTF